MTNAHKFYSWIWKKLSIYTLCSICLLGFSYDSNAFTVSSAVVWPVNTTNSVYTASNVVFTWSWQTISLWKTTLYSSNWSISGTRPSDIIHSEKYGSLWFCRIVINTLPTLTVSGATWLIHCPSYNNFIIQGWNLIAWPTGATGATGMTWLSAYQIAQGGWFTGSEMEWIESLKGINWATGTTTHEIVFSTGAIFSWSTFTLDDGNVDASLSTWSTYVPLIAKKEGEFLLNINSLLNALIFVMLFLTTIFTIFKLWYKKPTL